MFMQSLGINIDVETLSALEAIARDWKCSVEEIIILSVLVYVRQKSQSL